MSRADTLTKLIEGATKGPVYKRYCDDDNHMCMTVVSTKDWGGFNTGQFKDEPDTVAITFHQSMPAAGETPDCNETTTNLIAYLYNNAPAIRDLIAAAEEMEQDGTGIFELKEALANIKEQE